MDTLKEVIKEVMQGLKTHQPAQENLEGALKKSLSRRNLGHVKFRYFRRGILGIAVDSSAWLYQLNLEKEKLLAKLRKKSPQIKDVRFYIGEIQ